MRFAVVIERAGGNLAADVPDLPGCVATGPDRGAVFQAIREGIKTHLAGMTEDGAPVQEPKAIVEYVVAAA